VHALAKSREDLPIASVKLHAEQFALRMQAIHWLLTVEVDLAKTLKAMRREWRAKAETPAHKKLLKALLKAVQGQEELVHKLEQREGAIERVVSETVTVAQAGVTYDTLIADLRSSAPDAAHAAALEAWVNCTLDVETGLLLADAYLCDEVSLTPARVDELYAFITNASNAFDQGMDRWIVAFEQESVATVAEPAEVYRIVSKTAHLVSKQRQAPVRPALGMGAYAVPDIAVILGLPQAKVRRVLNELWDVRLGKEFFGEEISMRIARQKFVSFHVLIEFFVYFELRERGVSSQRILKARKAMTKDLDTPHPFATASVLHTRKKIWYEFEQDIIDADGTRQTNLGEIIEQFSEKIDFNGEKLAVRFWPLGKNRHVVVDPKHQFGAPTVPGTNVNAQVLYQMSRSGEQVETLAALYDLTEQDVRDAIQLYQRAA
jgi:uncharacterized protein (DUF433 family)